MAVPWGAGDTRILDARRSTLLVSEDSDESMTATQKIQHRLSALPPRSKSMIDYLRKRLADLEWRHQQHKFLTLAESASWSDRRG